MSNSSTLRPGGKAVSHDLGEPSTQESQALTDGGGGGLEDTRGASVTLTDDASSGEVEFDNSPLAEPLDSDVCEQIGGYPVHAAASLFPRATEAELAGLARDIRENGLQEPIVMLDGAVLDGRNRFLACIEAGIEPVFTEWDGKGNPTRWVLSKNAHRRHLSESQRALIASRLATLPKGGQVNAQICAFTQEQAAKELGVSRRLVQQVRAVKDSPALTIAIEDGTLKVGAAVQLLKLPGDTQSQAVKKIRAAEPGRARNKATSAWRRESKAAGTAAPVSTPPDRAAASDDGAVAPETVASHAEPSPVAPRTSAKEFEDALQVMDEFLWAASPDLRAESIERVREVLAVHEDSPAAGGAGSSPVAAGES